MDVPHVNDNRYSNEDKTLTYILFGGIFQAERTFEGLTIAYRVSAAWWFKTERYVESFPSEIEVI